MKTGIKIGMAAWMLISVSAMAAGGKSGNAPGQGGSGSGGGSGMGGGNPHPGTVKGDTFGDLYIIVRDSNGVPEYFTWDWTDADNPVPVPKSVEAGFVQPIALTEEQWLAEEIEGDWNLPDSCEGEEGLWLVPMNEEGEVAAGYEAYAQEVELGRLNLARSPVTVLDAAYQEALNAINSATEIDSDVTDRLVLKIDEAYKTIDSPRENLALYKKLMGAGSLTDLSDDAKGLLPGHLMFLANDNFEGRRLKNPALDQAGAFLAAAGDKGSEVTVDEIVYLNTTLGLNGSSFDSYVDYMGYHYNRNGFDSATAQLLAGPVLVEDVTWYYVDDEVDISLKVFGDVTRIEGIGIGAFSARVSDALKVLTYVHDRGIPEVADATVPDS